MSSPDITSLREEYEKYDSLANTYRELADAIANAIKKLQGTEAVVIHKQQFTPSETTESWRKKIIEVYKNNNNSPLIKTHLERKLGVDKIPGEVWSELQGKIWNGQGFHSEGEHRKKSYRLPDGLWAELQSEELQP